MVLACNPKAPKALNPGMCAPCRACRRRTSRWRRRLLLLGSSVLAGVSMFALLLAGEGGVMLGGGAQARRGRSRV